MAKKEISITIEEFGSSSELSNDDQLLLDKARKGTSPSYSPYSNFKVSAVAKLANGELVSGTNQENASYPVGICAERTLLSAVAVLYPGMAIDTMAISYLNGNGSSNQAISPCGICRQTLVEHEVRTGKSMRIILSGQEGNVLILPSAKSLLPLSFSADDMK